MTSVMILHAARRGGKGGGRMGGVTCFSIRTSSSCHSILMRRRQVPGVIERCTWKGGKVVGETETGRERGRYICRSGVNLDAL